MGLKDKALKKRMELRAKAEEAVECLRTDLNMLRDGTWVPDEDSCEDSLTMVDRIKKYMDSTK